MCLQPVYTDDTSKRQSYSLARHSSSCPDLSLFALKATPRSIHDRSNSLAVGAANSRKPSTNLQRAQSDSDLHYFDRQKTFENSSNSFGKDDLITKVVSALGSIQQQDQDDSEYAYNIFSDSQILSSEKHSSGWSLNRFSRSGSLCGSNQLTMNGKSFNDSRPTLLMDKDRTTRPVEFNRSVSLNIPDDDDENLKNIMNREVINRMLERTNTPRIRHQSESERNSVTFAETDLPSEIMDRKNIKRGSIISLPREYLSATSRGRSSVLSILDAPINSTNSELLENTSIADLIRALEVAHATSMKEEDMSLTSPTKPPKMKNHLTQIMNSRRGSLRPLSSYTTIFNSSEGKDPTRKTSTTSTPDPSMFQPQYPPPQYLAFPAVKRFTRGKSLRTERSNQPGLGSSLRQKKLPHGPSPLARNS